MPKMTKKQELSRHNAQMLVFALTDRVFSVVKRSDVPFTDCLKLASPELRQGHADALAKLSELETALVANGRGYRDQWGQFRPYV